MGYQLRERESSKRVREEYEFRLSKEGRKKKKKQNTRSRRKEIKTGGLPNSFICQVHWPRRVGKDDEWRLIGPG